jgi:hypothetical protein
MSDNLIMASEQVLATPQGRKLFSGGCTYSTATLTTQALHAVVGPSLPSLSEALTRRDNVATWPPPTRRAAISLWCAEAGCHPCEVWDVAARLLEVAL